MSYEENQRLSPPRYPKWTGSEPCRSSDPDSFFVEYHSNDLRNTLKKICGECSMQVECGDYAIWFESKGWWGGLSASDRRKIRREKGIILGNELR